VFPFLDLLRAVEDGLVTKETKITVVFEFCMDCYLHDSSLRHDAKRYLHFYERSRDAITKTLTPLGYNFEIIANPKGQNEDGRPRLGAFEVFVDFPESDDIVKRVAMHSKLSSLYFPRADKISNRLVAALENGVDILDEGPGSGEDEFEYSHREY